MKKLITKHWASDKDIVEYCFKIPKKSLESLEIKTGLDGTDFLDGNITVIIKHER